MSRLAKGLLLGALHVALVLTIAGKYYSDRDSLPRAWAPTAPYDPSLPIRGRYLRLQLVVEVRGLAGIQGRARLSAENGKLVATASGSEEGEWVRRIADGRFVVAEPIAYFISEHVTDPSIRKPGEELWAEVSVPGKGAPRPVSIGVKKDGVLTPFVPR